MKPKGLPFSIALIVAVFALSTAVIPTFAASKEKVLLSFSGDDGLAPYAGLALDSAGNLYGTTYGGGAYGYGCVFQLVPGTQGKWTETLLYSFNFGADGVLPYAGLVLDREGNLYGTTKAGGDFGYGTVFELIRGQSGTWTETVLHSFDGNDGLSPVAGLVFDKSGNLYGTTLYGGDFGYGNVFQLTPDANGNWTEMTLYSLAGNGTDGSYPYGGVVFDAAGNLYGTTYSGGAYNGGTVFQLTPAGNGNWTETVLHSLGKNKDGINPYDGVVIDAKGNLYGTANSGGSHDRGAVFRLTPSGNGQWTETILHSFDLQRDASRPYGSLVFGVSGALYGTGYSGGLQGYGAIFRLTPAENGKWTGKVLYSFNLSDGDGPYSGLILDHRGNLFGTTQYGGGDGCGGLGCGVVFEIHP